MNEDRPLAMSQQYSRRQILRAFALGGGLIAGELWVPGARLISIPSAGVDSELDILTFNEDNLEIMNVLANAGDRPIKLRPTRYLSDPDSFFFTTAKHPKSWRHIKGVVFEEGK